MSCVTLRLIVFPDALSRGLLGHGRKKVADFQRNHVLMDSSRLGSGHVPKILIYVVKLFFFTP